MLVIRLTRVGKKKQPTFRIVVQDKHKDPWGKALDIIGSYNARTTPKTIVIKADAAKAWIAKGAQPSPAVHNLLVDAKIIEDKKSKAHTGNRADGTKDTKKTEEKKK